MDNYLPNGLGTLSREGAVVFEGKFVNGVYHGNDEEETRSHLDDDTGNLYIVYLDCIENRVKGILKNKKIKIRR